MTVTIEKADGELTRTSRERFTDFYRNIPDGESVVTVWQSGEALAGIERIAAWYNSIDEVKANDPALLDSLVVKSSELAFYRYRLSQELGLLYEEKAGTEFRRKRGYFAELARLKKEAGAQKPPEKFVFSTAEILAENEIAELRKDEFLADSLWQQARLVYESAGDILQRMSQHISYLKSFRDAVMRSDNSNFPQQ